MVISKSNNKSNHPLGGIWHIFEMELWSEDYFNMETQAFINVESACTGEFQFGLVAGSLDGKLSENRFIFTWDGQDEMDEASGSGWLQLLSEDEIEGQINFHFGDSSLFKARKVS